MSLLVLKRYNSMFGSICRAVIGFGRIQLFMFCRYRLTSVSGRFYRSVKNQVCVIIIVDEIINLLSQVGSVNKEYAQMSKYNITVPLK